MLKKKEPSIWTRLRNQLTATQFIRSFENSAPGHFMFRRQGTPAETTKLFKLKSEAREGVSMLTVQKIAWRNQ